MIGDSDSWHWADLFLRPQPAILNPFNPAPPVARRLRRLRRLRLLTTGHHDCRYAGLIDCRAPLDDAKSYELAPGQKRMRGEEVVGENTRKTTAEVYEEAYASGARGGAGKLPDGYVKESADIDKTQQRLDESILDLRKNAATDSASDPTAQARITLEIKQMQRESVLLDRKKHIAGIRHGVITAEQEAARLGPRLRNLDDVNSVLREAGEIVGVEWANKLADALSQSGAVKGADDRDREGTQDIRDAAPDENAVESRRNQDRTGILSGNVLSPSWKPTFATEPELSPIERQQQQEFDNRRIRVQASEARTAEMRARIHPDLIARMSAEEAQKILDTYGTEIPGRARAALNAKLR